MPLGTWAIPNPKAQAINGKGSGTGSGPGKWSDNWPNRRIQPSRVILSLFTTLKEVKVVHLIVWNHAWKFPSWPPLVLEQSGLTPTLGPAGASGSLTSQ